MVSDTIDVAYVAELARLTLTPEEKHLFQQQLDKIVHYVEKIGELDVSNIGPTTHGQALTNVFREDVEVVPLDREQYLANAPARHGYEFKLPKIVEDA